MAQPGQYNIKLQRRADFGMLLEFKDSDGNFFDLTGWQVFAQAWDFARSQKYFDFSVDYVNRPQGRIRLRIGYSLTINLPGEAFYDVLMVSPSGLREYYLEGSIVVSEGLTTTA